MEKPKPIVILDRHRYLEKMMEEHKKMEEKKKIEENEKAKKELEIAEKKKEEEIKNLEKSKEIININKIESTIKNEISINTKNEKKEEILDKNNNKENEIKNKGNNANIKNDENNNTKKDNNSKILKTSFIKPAEDIPTERKIKEKIELNNLIKNLNYIEEDDIQENTEINFEIPYYLTKEWVVKNLLS